MVLPVTAGSPDQWLWDAPIPWVPKPTRTLIQRLRAFSRGRQNPTATLLFSFLSLSAPSFRSALEEPGAFFCLGRFFSSSVAVSLSFNLLSSLSILHSSLSLPSLAIVVLQSEFLGFSSNIPDTYRERLSPRG